jgi:hypothetical protein
MHYTISRVSAWAVEAPLAQVTRLDDLGNLRASGCLKQPNRKLVPGYMEFLKRRHHHSQYLIRSHHDSHVARTMFYMDTQPRYATGLTF